jgi:hypothetical protein
MKISLLSLLLLIAISFSAIGQTGWTGKLTVANVHINRTTNIYFSECANPPNCSLPYYVFSSTDTAQKNRILSMLLSAQANGAKVVILQDGLDTDGTSIKFQIIHVVQ